jgi:hypothetical protein
MFARIRIYFGSCRHYFVKQGGVWTCTLCGETR